MGVDLVTQKYYTETQNNIEKNVKKNERLVKNMTDKACNSYIKPISILRQQVNSEDLEAFKQSEVFHSGSEFQFHVSFK